MGHKPREGGALRQAIRHVIRRHVAEIRFCYESKGLARNPKLQGNVKIQFVIQPDGHVTSATVVSTTLRDPPTEQCLISALLKWRFPKPPNGGDVVVRYPFVFRAHSTASSGKVVGKAGGKAGGSPPKTPPPQDRLDAPAIKRVIRWHTAQIRYCYESRGLARDPKLKGRVKVRFVIQPDGHVASAVVVSSTLKDPPTERCLTAAIRRWRFPRPVAGLPVTVTYPFNFVPPKKDK